MSTHPDYMSGRRTSEPGGSGVNGWTRTAAGGLGRAQSATDDEVLDSLIYETPDQIRDREFAEDAAKEAALVAEEAAARKAERIAVRTIISRRAAAGETPTRDELRLIADTSIAEAGPHARFADAALLAQTLIEQNPDAAYIAFEDEVELGSHGLADTHIRKAVILNANFARIDVIEQRSYYDLELVENWLAAEATGSDTNPDELSRRLARVFPAVHGSVVTLDTRGAKYNRPTQVLKLTAEARSFAGDTHPQVPNLLTLAPAAAWIPGPLPVKPVAPVVDEKTSIFQKMFGRR